MPLLQGGFPCYAAPVGNLLLDARFPRPPGSSMYSATPRVRSKQTVFTRSARPAAFWRSTSAAVLAISGPAVTDAHFAAVGVSCLDRVVVAGLEGASALHRPIMD